MALFGRLSGRSLALFRSSRSTDLRVPQRSLTTIQLWPRAGSRTPLARGSQCPRQRTLTCSARRAITGQEAPSAKAYIESGVIGNQKKLVDVKKVLVIGSGGLSIGQAGEFDYSGKFIEAKSSRFPSGLDPYSTAIETNRSCLADIQDPKP